MKNPTKLKYLAVTAATILTPYIAFAETRTLKDIIGMVSGYLNDALLMLMGFAVLAFVFYVVKYFIMANDKRTEAAQYVMWSLIGFFIILCMWGLVNILVSTFNLHPGSPRSWTELNSLFPTSSNTTSKK
jgi:hypothetical protein